MASKGQAGITPATTLPEDFGARSAQESFKDDSDPFQIRQVLLGDYIVQQQLGRGGMGVVYLVERQSDQRQFALKTIRATEDRLRNAFLREFRTWIDLPPHPHLAKCFFFRTIANREAVFAEFIDGGSLHDLLQHRPLTESGQILDLAIQTAWGLHAAHEAGVIHRDVKPSNLLVSRDGNVKVCDFGVSSVRSFLEQSKMAPDRRTQRTTNSAGMTLAYRSPEQAARQPLTRATDQWSWALCVLEMFLRDRTWAAGEAASQVLAESTSLPRPNGDQARIPQEIYDVLKRCFQQKPTDRWPDMLAIADTLVESYRRLTGRTYPRTIPTFPRLKQQGQPPLDQNDDEHHEVLDLYRAALRADGREATELESLLKSAYFSETGKFADELVILDEARRILERLIESGRRDLLAQLGSVHLNTGVLHRVVGDYAGSLRQFDRTIEIREELVRTNNDSASRTSRLYAYVEKGRTLSKAGQEKDANQFYNEKLFAAVEECPKGSKDDDIRYCLAFGTFLFEMGNNSFKSGDPVAAKWNFERALKTLLPHEGLVIVGQLQRQITRNLVHVHTKLGNFAAAEKAAHWVNQVSDAIAEVEPAAFTSDETDLAMTLANRAHLESEKGNFTSAVMLQRQAVAELERMVHQQGQRRLAGDLANELGNLGVILSRAGSNEESLTVFRRAEEIYRMLIDSEGRTHLRRALAKSLLNSEVSLRKLRRFPDAVTTLREVMSLLEPDLAAEAHPQVMFDLAMAYSDMGYIRSEQRKSREALDYMQRSRSLLRRLVYEFHREDYRQLLVGVEQNVDALS